jgi:hypothetical protein
MVKIYQWAKLPKYRGRFCSKKQKAGATVCIFLHSVAPKK